MNEQNPTGLAGIEFIEFSSPDPEKLHQLFLAFGFSRTMRHSKRAVDLYEQGEIRFLLNRESAGAGGTFAKLHGPSVSAMGWRFEDVEAGAKVAKDRGAVVTREGDYASTGAPVPAIVGIGEMLLYMVPPRAGQKLYEELGFVALDNPDRVPPGGFSRVDHLTNNVRKGTMERWAGFYKEIFGFVEVRYFDIRGVKTGLTSYALRSPCGTFCIPINEADEAKSQINEYLDEYKGPGVQHIAFLTDNILGSLATLEGKPVSFLDIEADYYAEVFGRIPNVKEDHAEIQRRNVLVDGDDEGYLLQIFTKNLIGPIFIELIQRNNHLSFGEGNFGALFRSIEREQAKRGVFNT